MQKQNHSFSPPNLPQQPPQEQTQSTLPHACLLFRSLRRCRHEEVAREVLEASKVAAEDPVKQFAIDFFDNKFNSLVPLKITYFLE